MKNCNRCNNRFKDNPIIGGDDTCSTCSRMNNISFWLPKLQSLNFPMPETTLIYTDIDWSKVDKGLWKKLIKDIEEAGEKYGYPFFLKTGTLANKHDWNNSCFVSNKEVIHSHVMNLVDHSGTVTIDRFEPCDFWAVRKMLDVEVFDKYFHGDMPITKEMRYFVYNGKIECSHNYWVKEAFGDDFDYKGYLEFCEDMEEDREITDKMARYIAQAFHGSWSVDLMKTKSGDWYLTDMAIGERSYHPKHED